MHKEISRLGRAGTARKCIKKHAARVKLLFCLLREIVIRDGSLEKCWEGEGGGDFKTCKIDARLFFFEHVIKVEIFFFPSRGIYIFFGQNP